MDAILTFPWIGGWALAVGVAGTLGGAWSARRAPAGDEPRGHGGAVTSLGLGIALGMAWWAATSARIGDDCAGDGWLLFGGIVAGFVAASSGAGAARTRARTGAQGGAGVVARAILALIAALLAAPLLLAGAYFGTRACAG